MKQKRTGLFALALTSVMTVSALVPSAFAAADTVPDAVSSATPSESADTRDGKGRFVHRGGRQSEEAAVETGVGKDAAKAAALSDVGLGAEQAEKVKAKYSARDGVAAYRVSFVYGDTAYTYKIDAKTGAIIDKQTEAIEDAQSRAKRNKLGKDVKSAEAGIGKEAAKESALSAAGLTAEQVSKVRARYTTQDETDVYKVSFRYNGQKYSYVINAQTGVVMSHTAEATNV